MGTKAGKKVILTISGISVVCAAGLVLWFLWGGGKSYIPESAINKALEKPLIQEAKETPGEGTVWLKDCIILDLVKEKDTYYVVAAAEFEGDASQEDNILIANRVVRLFAVRRNGFTVNAKPLMTAEKSLSPGYAVNYYKTPDSQLLYGNLKDIAWEPKSDQQLPVDYETIKVLNKDRTLLEKNVKGKKGFILLLDPKEHITEVDVSDAKNNVPGKTLREDIFDIDEGK